MNDQSSQNQNFVNYCLDGVLTDGKDSIIHTFINP